MILDIILLAVIFALIIERYFYAKDMNAQVSDNFKALLSRNANEYASLKGMDNKTPMKPIEKDEIPVENLTDEEFAKALKEDVLHG